VAALSVSPAARTATGVEVTCKGKIKRFGEDRPMNESIRVRRRFYKALYSGLCIVWPVLSLLISAIIGLGLVISYVEAWKPLEGVYFAFVTGLTVGYGDFVPKHSVSRVIAVSISFTGILFTAIFAAVSVRALEEAVKEKSLPES
jgi:hypothetical protein